MSTPVDQSPTYYISHDNEVGKIRVSAIYPGGKRKLSALILASRQKWKNAGEATAYGMTLAKQHSMIFVHDRDVDDVSYRESMLLD